MCKHTKEEASFSLSSSAQGARWLHLARRRAEPQIERQRYYYSKSRTFEQSVDVYRPADSLTTEGGDSPPKRPLVVFVVGSGWLGHRAFVYTGTSWWNASGPRTLARLGCVTVCVRHRGAFPTPPKFPVWAVTAVVIAAAAARSSLAVGTDVGTAAVAALVLATAAAVWAIWAVAARGAATFEDMCDDVAQALAWVRENRGSDALAPAASAPVVFGGYSSGGHVAAAVMQRPELLARRGLPPPEEMCDAVLMVSGVLATRPLSDCGSSCNGAKPRWMTDLVVRTVFGAEGAAKLPSPLHGRPPRLPHLLVGCAQEAFGIDWLDVFFCSRDFAAKLRDGGVPARYIEVQSDHWNILGSRELARVLDEELRWISAEEIAGVEKSELPCHARFVSWAIVLGCMPVLLPLSTLNICGSSGVREFLLRLVFGALFWVACQFYGCTARSTQVAMKAE